MNDHVTGEHHAAIPAAEPVLQVARVLALADLIEKQAAQPTLGVGFNMLSYASDSYADRSAHNCGTTACIAGWCTVLRGEWSEKVVNCLHTQEYDHHGLAAEYLGLAPGQATYLFISSPAAVFMDDITPQMAVRTLRHLAATGEVDWNAANPEHSKWHGE